MAVRCSPAGLAEAFIPWHAANVGRPGWHHWAAFEEVEPVGFAALSMEGRTGWLGFAGTQASHRKRGFQCALITARLRGGCRRRDSSGRRLAFL